MRWRDAWKNRQPGRPWWRIAWWHWLHFLCFVWVGPAYRYRAWGLHHIPRTGPILLVSNHQSYLDPILVGLASHRRQFYALARSTLFDHPFFAWLIRSLNAVPVARGTSDMAAMRMCLDVLNEGQALLVFPEGTRTPDGKTHAFAPGTMLLIKRGNPMVVPVAVEGSHAAWPKGRKVPRGTGRIGVMYGRPIPAKQLLAMGSQNALKLLQESVEAMRLDIARKID